MAVLKSENVLKGKYAKWPFDTDYKEPSKTGYRFKGWLFGDRLYLPPYDANDFGPINEKTKIEAVWEEIVYDCDVTIYDLTTGNNNMVLRIEFDSPDTMAHMMSNGAASIGIEKVEELSEDGKILTLSFTGKTNIVNLQIVLSSEKFIEANGGRNYVTLFRNGSWVIDQVNENLGGKFRFCYRNVNDFYIRPILCNSHEDARYSLMNGYINTDESIGVTGNSTFIGVVPEGHDLSTTQYLGDKNNVWTFPIDDWGFIFNRLYQYDEWPGGVENTTFDVLERIQNDGKESILKFKSEYDEDNTILLEGCYLNKVFKVPYAGTNGVEEIFIDVYPMAFNDASDYKGNVDITLWDYQNSMYLEYKNGTFINEYYGVSIPLSNTIFNVLECERIDSCKLKLRYSVKSTILDNYDDYPLVIGDGCMVHIIREPKLNAEKRVYFGKPSSPYYKDKRYQYFDDCTHEYIYPGDSKYLIHTMGSRIIKDDYVEIVPHVTDCRFVIPDSLFDTYSVCIDRYGSQSVVSRSDKVGSFSWGEVVYDFFYTTLGLDKKLIFTKNRP
jgi:hypothetical protein